MMTARPCSIPGCHHPRETSRGWCLKHFGHWLAHGDPVVIKRYGRPSFRVLPRDPPEIRFWHYVEITPACWNWCGPQTRGYGVFCHKQFYGSVLAHRYAYELLVGPIPPDTDIHHACRNRACMNPAHLVPVAAKEHRALARKHHRWPVPKGRPLTTDEILEELGIP